MKRINIFLGGLAALLLSSCFSDKSNYDYLQPVDIRVEGVDEAYTVSPTGDRLQIIPITDNMIASGRWFPHRHLGATSPTRSHVIAIWIMLST